MDLSKASFFGYKRENGRVGVRNHVVILPVDDLSNAAAQAVEHNIKGTIALPHPYGRLQFGADLDLHFRTLIGTGSNPNVAAVVVICIEEQWAKKVADGIRATGNRSGTTVRLVGTSMAAPQMARQLATKLEAPFDLYPPDPERNGDPCLTPKPELIPRS